MKHIKTVSKAQTQVLTVLATIVSLLSAITPIVTLFVQKSAGTNAR